MKSGLKFTLGGTLVAIVAIGGEFLWLQHKRNAEDAPVVTKSTHKADPDDSVFLKSEHPMLFQDAKDMKGRTLWVSAGGQMDYYPVKGKTVDYTHPLGVLLGAEKITVTDAVQQVAPKKAAFRIPQGDKQVLLLFTKADGATQYAVPVGFKQGAEYTFSTDQIFFYEDPRKLFSYWGPDVWKAIDEHRVIVGMTEREAQMALGQVIDPHGETVGERTVDFDNQGKPVKVDFSGGKATKIQSVKQ